jgi:hypothetical protein
MKKIVVTSISALVLLSSSAFAGTVRNIADCGLAQPSADNNLNVALVETFATRVGVNDQSVITATVTKDTTTGSELVGEYVVKFVPPGLDSNEGSYVGEGFQMSVPLTPGPGTSQSHASISIVGNQPELKGVTFNEQLLCTFN